MSNFLLRIIIRHIINFKKKNLTALHHSNFVLFESTDFDFHENQYKELFEKYMLIKIISRGTLQLYVLIPRSML